MTNEEYEKLRKLCGMTDNDCYEKEEILSDVVENMLMLGWDKYTAKREFYKLWGAKNNKTAKASDNTGENEGIDIYDFTPDTKPENTSLHKQQLEEEDERTKKLGKEKIQLIKDIYAGLDEKAKNRLFALYLKFYNTIDSLATSSPSDWRPELKEKFNRKYPGNMRSYLFGKERTKEEKMAYKKVHAHRTPYEAKKLFLLAEMIDADRLMHVLADSVFPKELKVVDQQKKREAYFRCYELAQFTQRPSRDIKNLLECFRPLFKDSDVWRQVQEAFSFVSIKRKLSKEGQKAWSFRDKLIKPALELEACRPEYRILIYLQALWDCAIEYGFTFPKTTKQLEEIQKFAPHFRKCKQCKKVHEALKNALALRLDQKKASEGWQRLLYPKHFYTPEGALQTKNQDCAAYYENNRDTFASPLYDYYLQTAHNLAGKTNSDPVREQKEVDVSALPYRDYMLSVRCICGIETQYPLNHYRVDKVLFGRLQQDGVQTATINVCSDDKYHMSRQMLQWEYDSQENDWFLSACGENEEDRRKKGARIGYISFDNLKKGNAQISTNASGKAVQCRQLWEREFVPLGSKRVPLREVAGIGIIQISDGKTLSFNGTNISGVEHPILGKLPFGWYIDVFPRQKQQALRSFVGKTVNNVQNEQEERENILPSDNRTIIE